MLDALGRIALAFTLAIALWLLVLCATGAFAEEFDDFGYSGLTDWNGYLIADPSIGAEDAPVYRPTDAYLGVPNLWAIPPGYGFYDPYAPMIGPEHCREIR